MLTQSHVDAHNIERLVYDDQSDQANPPLGGQYFSSTGVVRRTSPELSTVMFTLPSWLPFLRDVKES